MSFKVSDLSVLAYANNFTLWHYVTQDDAITTAGYFDKAADMLRVNDLIIANIDTDGSTATATVFYVVTANTGSSVTIEAYS
ncbi:MAG: hypothetical protein CMH27_11530 [Micavibrio sp.]|nr:hypothetical protein [Micavibrio sp.]|tara:strand:+ start:107 stop:352 length:246 start_codon:yes stop_codon:yes gene_type:complete